MTPYPISPADNGAPQRTDSSRTLRTSLRQPTDDDARAFAALLDFPDPAAEVDTASAPGKARDTAAFRKAGETDDGSPPIRQRRCAAQVADDERRGPEPDTAAVPDGRPLSTATPDMPSSTTIGADEIAQLLERCARQWALTGGDADGRRMIIELDARILPDTTLTLTRTAAGWTLTATTGTAAARLALARHAPALRARFERRALGALDIVTDDAEDRGHT